MRSRRFRFPDTEKALRYISFLCSQGYSFQVTCATGHCDVTTPFDIAPHDFPNPKDLAR